LLNPNLFKLNRLATLSMSQAMEEAPIEISEQKKRVKYWQVDALKAFAIALVVMDHSLTWELKSAIGGVFWERTAIPIFMIVMGFNMGLSFKNRGATTLRELYSWRYFKSKIERYVFPFLLLYLGSFLLGVYFNAITFNEYSLIGWLPFWGPGNWFIPVLFGSILVLPLIYRGYLSYPKLTVFLCFMSEILLQLFMFYNLPLVLVDGSWLFQSYEAAFLSSVIRTSILFLLPGVGLGLWFSDDHNVKSRRNAAMWVAFPLSVAYMVAYQILGYRAEIIDGLYRYRLISGDYTFLLIPYTALIFLLAMKYLPSKPEGRLQNLIKRVGRASYHILLVQILYYSVWYYMNRNWAYIGFGTDYLSHVLFYLFNVVITFAGGILWYEAENAAYKRGKPFWRHNYARRAVYGTGAFMSIAVLGMVIEIVSELTGLAEWQRTHGPFFVLNQWTGPGVVANIIVIIIMLGVCLFFIYKAFMSMDDEIPPEVLNGGPMP